MYYLPHIRPSLKKTSHSLKPGIYFPGSKSHQTQFSHVTAISKILHHLPYHKSLKQQEFAHYFLLQDCVYATLTYGGCLAGDICGTVAVVFIGVYSKSFCFPKISTQIRHRGAGLYLLPEMPTLSCITGDSCGKQISATS